MSDGPESYDGFEENRRQRSERGSVYGSQPGFYAPSEGRRSRRSLRSSNRATRGSNNGPRGEPFGWRPFSINPTPPITPSEFGGRRRRRYPEPYSVNPTAPVPPSDNGGRGRRGCSPSSSGFWTRRFGTFSSGFAREPRERRYDSPSPPRLRRNSSRRPSFGRGRLWSAGPDDIKYEPLSSRSGFYGFRAPSPPRRLYDDEYDDRMNYLPPLGAGLRRRSEMGMSGPGRGCNCLECTGDGRGGPFGRSGRPSTGRYEELRGDYEVNIFFGNDYDDDRGYASGDDDW